VTDVSDRPTTTPPKSRRAVRTGGRIANGARRLADDFRRLVRSPVLLVAVLVIAAATGLRIWAMTQTWFWLDDLSLINIAARSGLTWDALTTQYVGHLMPGGHVLAWMLTLGGPYNHTVAIIQLTVLYVIACLAVLRLLVTLFGVRAGILFPLAYFAFSPWLIPATSWWSAGINHLPTLAASALALDAHVRYLRSPARRYLIASVVWVLVGLFFAELAMLVYVPLTVITFAYFATGGVSDRVHRVWSTYRSALITHGVLVAAYAAVYLSARTTMLNSTDPVQLRPYFTTFVTQTFPVAGIGGPGAWERVWAAQFEIRPSAITQLVGLAVVGAVFAVTALKRERGLRAWLIPLLQLAACMVLMLKSRSLFGAGLALDLRFTTPLALGVALGFGLAFLPVVGALESASPRDGRRSWLVDRWPVPTATLACYVAFAAVSAANFPLLHVPDDRSPRVFYDTFARSIAAHTTPVDMVPSAVPSRVIPGPEGDARRALVKWSDQIRFPEVVQDEFYTVDENGNLVHPSLDVARRAVRPDPAEQSASCEDGYLLDSTDRNVTLDGPVYGYAWRARLTYDASAETPVTIRHGDDTTQTTFLEGEHVMELPAGGEYDRIGFSGIDPGTEVCLSNLEVGTTTIPGLHPVD
jgi:hypothetical protein